MPNEPRTPRELYHAALPVGEAIRVTAVSIAAIYALQVIAAMVAAPAVAFIVGYGATALGLAALARARGFRLSTKRVALRFWIAAVLVGTTAWYVDLALVSWIVPAGDARHLKTLVDELPFAAALLALAIVPAIAEEIVFRGVLARSIARHSITGAIVASALAFSLYHMQLVQMVATFPLGVALAIIAVRSDSIAPGMLTHFLNNALVIAMSRNALPGATELLERYPATAFAIALAGMAIGVILPNCKVRDRPHVNCRGCYN